MSTVTRRHCPLCPWAEERSSYNALSQLADEEELEDLLAEHIQKMHPKENSQKDKNHA